MDQTTPPISPSHDALSDEGPPSSPASRRNLTVSSNLLAWGTASAVVGLFILRFGYHVGWSDQDEFLPLIQHWIDPNLFTHDWFVMMQTSTFGIRTAFATALWGLSNLASLELAVLIVQLGSAFAICLAIFRISERLSPVPWMPVVSTIVAVLITARMNPGGNDVLHAFLVPSSVGWAAALWALYHVLAGRAILAGLFIAGALWMHPLVGLQTGSVLCLVALMASGWKLKQVWPTLLLFASSAIPLILLLANLGAPSAPSTSLVTEAFPMLSMDPAWILTEVRSPHHYLPTTFPLQDWLWFFAIVLTAGGFLIASSRMGSKLAANDNGSMQLLFVVLLCVLGGAFLVTGWPWQIPFLVRLQPFHLSPLLRIVSVLLITAGVSRLLARFAFVASLSRLLPLVMPIAGGLLLVIGLWKIQPNGYLDRSADAQLHRWVASSTSEDAVFAIPPSMSGFQYGTGRAQFISFKSFPFTPDGSKEWIHRLHELAPVSSWLPGGTPLLDRLDESWSNRSISDMAKVLLSQDIDYLVRPVPDPANWDKVLEPQWCSETWCVYWAGRILMRPSEPTS